MSISFKYEYGGIPLVTISNRHASAVISLNGGHVMEYVRHGEPPVLWMSHNSCLEMGKPIRGGIPVCWPWFGAHPTNKNMPAHGFARICRWEIERAEEINPDISTVMLSLTEKQVPKQFAASPFHLIMTISIGAELEISLKIMNTGKKTLKYSGALHTYFNISEIRKIKITGLEGIPYYDALAGENGMDSTPIKFKSEFDCVYFDKGDPCVIHDPQYKRRIVITKSGSLSSVVWNPWVAKSKRLQDFGDLDYHTMVCVETANARQDSRSLKPGKSHTITSKIFAENYE